MLETRSARSVFLALAVLAALAGAACQKSQAGTPPAAAAAPAAPQPNDVVAEFGSEKITRAELDRKREDRLMRIRQQEYELSRQVLQEMVYDRLVAKEASDRGISREEYLAREIDAKVAPPNAAELGELYEQNKARFGAQPKEAAIAYISAAMLDQRREERQAAFAREVLGRYDVKLRLSPPRAKVTVPADAPTLGPADAPVTIVAYADYQCPYCQRSQPVVEQVLAEYKGKVRLVHRDFPLNIHPQALPASHAARCAAEQGKFWEYHRSLLGSPGDFQKQDLLRRAGEVGMKLPEFTACMESNRHDAAIQQAIDEGTRLGVSGTPAFFINGQVFFGAYPIERFREVIDAELAGS